MDIREQLKELELTDVAVVGKELGRGSYGVVTEVKVNGLRCAAKQLHQVLQEAGQELIKCRFVEECLQHSRQRHPKIVQLLGVYFPSPRASLPLILLEMMEMTLTKCLDKHPNLPSTLRNDMLIDVAQGLLYLHSQSPPIIHRDLTSNNILLNRNLVAKISDLGVAKLFNPSHSSKLTKLPGAVTYMPPEALTSRPVYDTKLDIFSFGVLILHIYTNKLPTPTDEFVMEPETTLYRRVTEVKRREEYLLEMGDEHTHADLVHSCLQNQPKSRLTAELVLRCLQSITSKIGCFPSRLDLLEDPGKFSFYPSSSSLPPTTPPPSNTENSSSSTQSEASPLPEDAISPSTPTSPTAVETGSDDVPVRAYTFSRRSAVIYTNSFRTRKLTGPSSHSAVSRKVSSGDDFTDLGGDLVVKTLYKYDPQGPRDLAFNKDETLHILKKSSGIKWLARSLKTGKEGHVLSSYVIPAEWYFGKMKPATAEKKLLQTGIESGTFLIRESENYPDNFSLSVRYDQKTVRHYNITKTAHDSFYISPKSMCNTVEGLIRYYMTACNGLCCLLTVPCPKRDRPTAYRWETDHSQINLKRCIGTSMLGEVWDGVWKETIPVGIKIRNADVMSCSRFLSIAEVMKKLNHEQLIQLYGVCTTEPMMLVTEFMKFGCLVEYLQRPGRGCNLRLPVLVYMAKQIASGMAYLQSQSYIHRDLAARNVQVTEGNRVKIADFSLTIHTSSAPSQSTLVPVKWTAPEAVKENRFSSKSDVWSFGVFLMELVTRGSIPFPQKPIEEVLLMVEQGYRMPCPHQCPDSLYQIMMDCWKLDPKDRPTFDQLYATLKDF